MNSDIIIFGAGGRVGRAAVAEAVARGHRVTAVVRDPAKYQDLGGERVAVVQGDVTDPRSVAALAPGHRAAVNASARLDIGSEDHFTAAAGALIAGLAEAGVRRLLVLGIATTLETAPGVRIMDGADFPAQWRAFAQGHVAEFELLSTAGPELDWLMVVPPLDLTAEAAPTGGYRTAVGTVLDGPGRISHADLALALLDEIEAPRHSRVQLAVTAAAAGA
ncbi:NAD(P)-dependent oxidoreductase [Streptomyces sp. NRRL B-1347]|uniref:NAD(P)-dependent oxidoreductase n=1 Tax=Streptomyces sp. NRRL B-1347 TaxID=1476877 RepID=UPI00099DC19D|nr:NAD(P)H-binding protein [Streptomyces sp. NRRL B-1347]